MHTNTPTKTNPQMCQQPHAQDSTRDRDANVDNPKARHDFNQMHDLFINQMHDLFMQIASPPPPLQSSPDNDTDFPAN